MLPGPRLSLSPVPNQVLSYAETEAPGRLGVNGWFRHAYKLGPKQSLWQLQKTMTSKGP